MIIFRYLSREVLTTMAAVSLILLLVILSGRFAKLLSQAAAGQIDASVLMTVMGFMALRFLELILSLGLFIGILFSYGRLYTDSEMTVMSACGISESRLLSYTLIFSLPVALLVGGISLYLAPEGYKMTHAILEEQRSRTEFETIKPARFIEAQGGNGISYAGEISEDKKQLREVFIAQFASETDESKKAIIVAESGQTRVDMVSGRKYLVLKEGRRYEGIPGQKDFEIIEFEEFHQLLEQPTYTLDKDKETEGMSVVQLFSDSSREARAALHWRFSLPVLVIVTAFLAVPLSRTQPRRGRYGKLLPSILLYVTYVVLLEAARSKAEKIGGNSIFLIWVVHFIYVGIGLILYQWQVIGSWLYDRVSRTEIRGVSS